jgi:phage baseplate assembly protein W|tara:strand:- start:29625 stop:30032 length:408 start_codon:yes stop_codon:yes gene_type:complete
MAYRFNAERNLSRQFRDLSIGMKANPNTEDFSIVKNQNAIKQAMKNLILTGFGERPFQPTKGSRLRQMLFEPFDVFMSEELKEEMFNVLKTFEPRIVVNEIRMIPGEPNELEVEVDYTIVGETLIQTVDFLLEKV